MAFGESRIQIHDFTIFVESDTRTVPMEIEPPVPIQPPTLPEVTQKVSNYQTKFKGSPDSCHFIFEIDVGKSRIRHRTPLALNDEFLDRLKPIENSNSESLYVGSDSFRHLFQK